MDQTISLHERVARHDAEIKALGDRDNAQDEAWKQIAADIKELNKRFDAQNRLIITSLAGVVIDLILRLH